MSVSMREMLEAGVHFGHQTRFWNPKMAPFIYGHRNKIHIINLEKTQPLFDDAMKFVRQLAARRGTILMIGTKRQARDVIAMEAQRAGMPYVDQRWLGGMLTNFKTVKGSLKKLKDMQAQVEAGTQPAIKKEALMFQREIAKLEKDIGGIADMIDDGVHGRIVAPGDEAALAAALQQLAGDRAAVARMAAACRAKALAQFDCRAVARRILDKIASLPVNAR